MSAPPVLHPLGVGELLDGAIYLYRKNLSTLIGIGAVMAVPILVLQCAAAFLEFPLNPFLGGVFSPFCSCASLDLVTLVYLPFYYLENVVESGLLGSTAVVIQVGALAFAVSEQRMSRRVTIGGAYRRGLRRWTALLGSAILVQLSTLAASSLLIVPLVLMVFGEYFIGAALSYATLLAFIPFSVPLAFLAVRWSLTTPAIMLESLGALKGMGRSWHLVGKSFWRTGAVLLFAGVLVNLLTYAVFLAAQYAASLLPNSLFLATVVTSAGGLVAGAVIQPLAYVVVTLLYYDLRVRHEGYDFQLALDQLRQPAAAVATEAPG